MILQGILSLGGILFVCYLVVVERALVMARDMGGELSGGIINKRMAGLIWLYRISALLSGVITGAIIVNLVMNIVQ